MFASVPLYSCFLLYLQAICLPVRTSTASIIPNFQYEGKGRLPFVIIKRSSSNAQNSSIQADAEEDPDDSVFAQAVNRNSKTRYIIFVVDLNREIIVVWEKVFKQGEGEGEVAFYSAKYSDRRNRAQGVLPNFQYWGSMPVFPC